MLQHALYYAARGWHVFPACIEGKQKKSYSYKADAYGSGRNWGNTTDAVLIRSYYERFPAALVGIACGKESGVWVSEIDTKEGGHAHNGRVSLDELEAEHGKLPLTLQARSPSGSIHYYWSWPEGFDIRNSEGLIGPGIDVRGEGGMVIAPPSVRDDGAYEWVNDLPIADAPEWLVKLATEKGKASAASGTAIDPETIETPLVPSTFAGQVLADQYKRVVAAPVGRRNPALNNAAYRAGQYFQELPEDLAFRVLLAACATFGTDDQAHDLSTIKSGWDAGKKSPKPMVGEMFKDLPSLPVGSAPLAPDLPKCPVDLPGSEDEGTSEQETNYIAPKYLFETVSDLRSMPPQTWLAEKWIPEFSTGIIFGRYASGKSFVLFDLLLHLAYGMKEWHGVKLPGVPCYGLLIAREGHTGFRRRIDAFKKHHGIVDDTERIVFMRRSANFGDDAQFSELKTAIEKCGRQFRVVAVDTVGRALPGEDMFDPKSITRFMEHLQQLGEISKGVAIGVHHENKSGDVMGSIYFQNNSDFVFQVEREGDPKRDPLRRGKISCVKMKDGEDGWHKLVTYKPVATEPNGEGSLVVESITTMADIADETAKLSDRQQNMLNALREAIAAHGKLGRVQVEKWREVAYSRGFLDDDAKERSKQFGQAKSALIRKERVRVNKDMAGFARGRGQGAGTKGAPGGSMPDIPKRDLVYED